jgi:hypothetical protein
MGNHVTTIHAPARDHMIACEACRTKAVEFASRLGVDCYLSINFMPNAIYEPALSRHRGDHHTWKYPHKWGLDPPEVAHIGSTWVGAPADVLSPRGRGVRPRGVTAAKVGPLPVWLY